MRTTISLDDDVAALLHRARKARKGTLKAVVNDAMRQGLKDLLSPPRAKQSFSTHAVSLGRCLVGNVDDVAEVLNQDFSRFVG